MRTLVAGIGSILRRDDGVGPRVVDELEKEELPGDVTLHGADISGMDLLKFLPEPGRAIIIDAAEMNSEPGTVKVFGLREIKKADFNDRFSTHGMGLLDTLTLAENLGLDCEITIVGVQPADTGYGLEMTDLMRERVPAIAEKVKQLIRETGERDVK